MANGNVGLFNQGSHGLFCTAFSEEKNHEASIMTALLSWRVRRQVRLQRHLLGCLFSLIITLVGCSEQTPTTPIKETEAAAKANTEVSHLKFTAIPDQNTTELAAKFFPLALHLSQALDIGVTYVPARDYQASVEMFRNGDVHLAWFGGLTGVQARNAVPGARAIAQGESDPVYYSYFIAHRDTGLTRSDTLPADISEFTFTFGSQSSTSGRLMPEFFLREHTGKSPMDYFTNPIGFSGSHDKTAELVESGQYQIGAINYKVYDRRVADGRTNADVADIIWKTPTYADYNWTAHPDLEVIFGPGFTQKLQDTLIAIDDPSLLSALPRERLISATNEEFEGIRTVAKALKMIR
jgi:phosphonate transport system substrate-binding protein